MTMTNPVIAVEIHDGSITTVTGLPDGAKITFKSYESDAGLIDDDILKTDGEGNAFYVQTARATRDGVEWYS
tara:strand:+ start:149 stop:364 length:216 start_codon:yes stop_codon:yes gene_type:complete